jgi:hypothetical protein
LPITQRAAQFELHVSVETTVNVPLETRKAVSHF